MVGSRTATAAVGLVLSLTVSALLWWYTNSLVFFLVVPFVPFLFGGRETDSPPVRRCPQCGFETRTEEYAYCPRDGTPLE